MLATPPQTLLVSQTWSSGFRIPLPVYASSALKKKACTVIAGGLGLEPWSVKPFLADFIDFTTSFRRVSCTKYLC